MSKLRRQLSASTSNVVEPKNLFDLKQKTGNLYESIAVMAKRANQINIAVKEELHNTSFCLSLLSYNEKGLRKLLECFDLYRNKLGDPIVFENF